jgi:hypothetical protein
MIIVRAIDTASDSPTVFFAADTSFNRRSDAKISLHNVVPITDFYASHSHCTLNCIMQEGSRYTLSRYDVSHTFEQYAQFSIDAYNA